MAYSVDELAHIERSEDVLSRDTAQEKIAVLEPGGQDAWAAVTPEMFRSHSPTSVVASTELLRAGAQAADPDAIRSALAGS